MIDSLFESLDPQGLPRHPVLAVLTRLEGAIHSKGERGLGVWGFRGLGFRVLGFRGLGFRV